MTPDDLKTIQQIEAASQGEKKIPASQVRVWLRTQSVEVLGAVVENVIREPRRVDPPMSIDEICRAVQEYYRQCLIQDLQDSDYAPNRSIAGYEFVGWFKSLWHNPAVPREYLVRVKTMLRDLGIQRKVPQDQMVGAVLEHLFETPQIAEFFADWRSDPQLKDAFDLAMEWAKDHRPPNLPQA